MDVGELIRERRKAVGYTQKELSEKSGVATVSIQQYERGVRQPRLEQLQSIASALGVSPLYLLGDETAKMSRDDAKASMGLEGYLKSLGYEFIVGYEYEGEEHDLCIDRKRKRLYLLPPQRLEVMEQSLETFTKFSLSELVSGGKEISDTEGWFSHRQSAQSPATAPPTVGKAVQGGGGGVPPTPDGKDTTPPSDAPEPPSDAPEPPTEGK